MSIKTPSDYEFVVENLTDLVCTHSGSVDLQAELDWDTLFLPTILFQSIEGRLVDVCRDTYGNYVIQKMLPLLSDNQICSFVNIIQRGFISIAITIPGSCVLDCLIAECESRKLEMALLPIFNANLAVLSQLQHGSHVLQTLIDKFDVELLTEVFRFVKRNFLSIATDRYGCCLIKKIVEKDSKAIIPQVLANLNNLCTVTTAMAAVGPFCVTLRLSCIEPVRKLHYPALFRPEAVRRMQFNHISTDGKLDDPSD